MMSLRRDIKSALLALVMMASVPAGTMRANEAVAPIKISVQAITDFFSKHPYLASSIAAFCFAAHCDINTKSGGEYSLSDLPGDVSQLVQANIINGDILKQMISFVRKYGFGLKVKFYTMDIPEKDENGVETGTINKGKKVLAQKPFGLYGYFDAYVLGQLEAFSKFIPTLAVVYLLLNDPVKSLGHAAEKAAK